MKITRSTLHTLLSFPKLEKLIVSPVEGFDSIFLQKMEKMTDFRIGFKDEFTINLESLCRAVKQMPMLHNLMIVGLMNKEQILQLVGEIVVYAASQRKNVVVFRDSSYCEDDVFNGIKISRKIWNTGDSSHEQNQTLNMLIGDKMSKTYLDHVKAFVETNMKDYETFMITGKDTVPLFDILL